MKRIACHGLATLLFGALVALECSSSAQSLLSTVSARDADGISASGGSFASALSADFRFVAFASSANNLASNDNAAPHLDVFARDRQTGRTVLVSINQTASGGGNGDSAFASISTNGQFIAFASSADDLVAGDANGASDVFVRDLIDATTRLVSVDISGAGSGMGGASWQSASGAPLISDDGRWVVFESSAANLVVNDTNGIQDVFARDLWANVTYLLSAGAEAAVENASQPARSSLAGATPDTARVVFVSTAANLIPGFTNSLGAIYVRDRDTGRTYWASSNAANYFAGAANAYRCFNPVISANGRFVGYKAAAAASASETATLVLYHDLETGLTDLVATNSLPDTHPALSADGRVVAYESDANVFAWDAHTKTAALVSVNWNGSGSGNGPSTSPELTPDGGKVVFLSRATDLVSGMGSPPGAAKQVYLRDLAAAKTELVSAAVDGSPSQGVQGTAPMVSADGRLVAFDTASNDLLPDDENDASDVFIRDVLARLTELVSRRNTTGPARTAAGHASVGRNSVSADGRLVVFTANDARLAPGDTNRFPDIFLRDLATGLARPVSFEAMAAPSSLVSKWPQLSADGQRVVFLRSAARDLMEILWRDLRTGDTRIIDPTAALSSWLLSPPGQVAISPNGRLVAFSTDEVRDFLPMFGSPASSLNVLIRDLVSGEHELVTPYVPFDSPVTNAAEGVSLNLTFSPDGRWLSFESTGRILSFHPTNPPPALGYSAKLYARDLRAKQTVLISSEPGFFGRATGACWSANSQRLAYSVHRASFVYDFAGGTNIYLGTNSTTPVLSGDGRLATFAIQNPLTRTSDIYLRDLCSGRTDLVSVNLTGIGPGNGDSSSPLITYGGRYVAFLSKASDLVAIDTNQDTDLFVRDLKAGTTMLITRSALDGCSGKGRTISAFLGADGRTVVFQSFAPDLIPGDFNYRSDVFVLRLGSEDSDGDGMDDDWEYAYFGSLKEEGTGDSDGDGSSEAAEYHAGTDPLRDQSVLRVLTVTSLRDGRKSLFWQAQPGRRYQVQFKDSVSDSIWTDLSDTVIAASDTASATDPSAHDHPRRFYRVRLAQ